jgi:hypothetical protein
VRFVEFLRTTVLLCAGAATLLATLTVLGASREYDPLLVSFSAVWWSLAALFGAYLGRHAELNPPITELLASARSTSTLPELRPGRTLLERLWSLLAFVVVAGGVGIVLPPVAAIGTGFAIALPLSIRRQERAVLAIEERDAVRFYVEPTSPFGRIGLIRTPGFGGDFLVAGGRG